MLSLWTQLVFMLVVILVASLIFTNAIEHFGHRIKISAGVTGSIFAAISTALPETIIPILAIVAGTANHATNEQISVGAILGAPMMLATLATALMAISVIKKRGLFGKITPEKSGFNRDLNCALAAILFSTIAMFLPHEPLAWRFGLSLVLVSLYVYYLVSTFTASKALVREGHGVIADEPLLAHRLGLPDNGIMIALQLFVALVLLVLGAKGFIVSIENISGYYDFSALILALLIVPIATELPEKVNSIIWVRRRKDTLAFGNLTGAMAFQATLLPALGILLTPWRPSKEVLIGIIITFIAAAWLRINSSIHGLHIMTLLVNGTLYLAYLGLIYTMYTHI